ncbi:MAG: serpin family protein [Clostridia bacterium]|nr:serpin family protein [Clostridia bacterium]
MKKVMRKMIKTVCVLCALLTVFVSCARGGIPAPVTDGQTESETTKTLTPIPHEEAKTLLENADLMRAFSQNVTLPRFESEAFRDAARKFDVALFQKIALNNRGKNLIVSPLSVMLALAMTAQGAEGQTKEEMLRLLGDGMTLNELNENLAAYTARLKSDDYTRISYADALFLNETGGFANAVKEAFLQANADYYRAGVFRLPFEDRAAAAINDWVKEHTDGMIEKIVDRLDPAAVMALLNALCFEASWYSTYKEENVKQGEFRTSAGAVTVEMLHGTVSDYLEDREGGAVGFMKDYADPRYTFTVLLPDEGVDVFDYIASLTPERLKNIFSGCRSGIVTTAMPKFKSDFSVNLNAILKDLGMPTAFDAVRADFSGMADWNETLYIGKVLHKGHIEVNETGTSAAAATAVLMYSGSIGGIEEYTVILDRPFVYMITDTLSGLPLFMGVLNTVEN